MLKLNPEWWYYQRNITDDTRVILYARLRPGAKVEINIRQPNGEPCRGSTPAATCWWRVFPKGTRWITSSEKEACDLVPPVFTPLTYEQAEALVTLAYLGGKVGDE